MTILKYLQKKICIVLNRTDKKKFEKGKIKFCSI